MLLFMGANHLGSNILYRVGTDLTQDGYYDSTKTALQLF